MGKNKKLVKIPKLKIVKIKLLKNNQFKILNKKKAKTFCHLPIHKSGQNQRTRSPRVEHA